MEALLLLVIFGTTAVWGVQAWLAQRAWEDMSRRGQPGWVYGAVVFFVPVLGLLIWALARRTGPSSNRSRGERAPAEP